MSAIAGVSHRFWTLLIVSVLWAGMSSAEYIGLSWQVTEDFIGDRHDRWRTGGAQIGLLFRPQVQHSPIDMVELRFAGEAATPWNLRRPDPGDRPFAGVLSVSALAYGQRDWAEVDIGIGLALSGPSTGIDDFFERVHLGDNELSDQTREDQVPDRLYPEAEVSVASRMPLGNGAAFRPFGRVQIGVENMATIGAEVIFGPAGADTLRIRDRVTGQLLPDTASTARGWSLTLGGDVSKVYDSELLPENHGVEAEGIRTRLRAGAFWRGERVQLFYGATWLGKEFEAQSEGQTLGSIQLSWGF